ncbi:uncharacterized protein LOC134827881 [Culicoides brevitarsis]|uniref:uncharacterized protein LOC134827881 n=1 Tax=Culicoides brevitarsis TaxID=469753 RepID=UPI00307C1DA5
MISVEKRNMMVKWQLNQIPSNIQKVPKICRKTTYNAEDMNETMAGQQKQSNVQSNLRKTEHFVDESMKIESNKTNRHQTILVPVPINDSLEDQMILEPKTNKSSKIRGTIYAAQDMNETLEAKTVEKGQKIRRQTNIAPISMNESDINSSNVVNGHPSKSARGTIYAAQEINETLIDENMMIEPKNEGQERKQSKNLRPTIYSTEDINETLTDEENSKKNLFSNKRPTSTETISMTESDMETTQNLVLQAAALTNIPPRLSRGTIYAPKEIDDTLHEDEKPEKTQELSKNALKRNRRVTTVENLSMNLSSLNVTPPSNIPRKKERRESPFHRDSVPYSDADLTLGNLSLAPNAHSTHHGARIQQDMNLTKGSTQKSGRTPSKIPVPARMKLEPKLTQGTDRKITFDKSIEIEKSRPKEDICDSDDMEETLVAEKSAMEEPKIDVNEEKFDQPDSLRRQTVANPMNSIRYSNIQMAELSTRRFKDLTIQDNELLDKESDINLTLSSTLTEPIKSNNASVYQPCSYANITLEKVVSPQVSINPVLIDSCVCSDTSMQENSFSVSKIAGISPNVSVRMSLGNEVVEQIRQRVLKQSPLYCKNCKCMSESRVNQSAFNSATSSAAPLIDWTRFPQVQHKNKSIDQMEKDFLQAYQSTDNKIKQYPEIPPFVFLMKNLKESLNEQLKEFEEELLSTDDRIPAPFPSDKPFEFLIKNKLESENLPWKVTRSLHAPIGKFQLRNNKLKSVLLHFEIEPNSLKSKEMFVYQSVKFIKNILHPPSSPFSAVLFDTFTKIVPIETSLLFMCQNSNSLFEFLAKMDETISQIHANVARLFSILTDNKANVYIENSKLVAKVSVIDDGFQIIRVFMNLADPNNFQLQDIRTEPDVPDFREFAATCNLKGIEFLEHFLGNIKQIVLNK